MITKYWNKQFKIKHNHTKSQQSNGCLDRQMDCRNSRIRMTFLDAPPNSDDFWKCSDTKITDANPQPMSGNISKQHRHTMINAQTGKYTERTSGFHSLRYFIELEFLHFLRFVFDVNFLCESF
jgi:hypothetical protein